MNNAPDEQIITLPWHLIHDSPLQYRQTYRQADLDELAASITATGRIQQPLVVRLRYPNPLFKDQYDTQDGVEIVFGHSRKRAGIQAGLERGPVIVRDMTDAEVRAAQLAENIARADVHPLEEAAGFRALLQEGQVTADDLAAQLGKSRSFVYGRLKLLMLCPEVRAAVVSGEVGSEVGLLIARVGPHKLQAKALGYIRGKGYTLGDGGKKSFRLIRNLLADHFTLDLSSALFDIEDEMLVPSAGHCHRCPKKSGNAPEWADLVAGDTRPHHYSRTNAGPDVCTDPDCFASKKAAHLKRQADKLAAEGCTVITGNKAKAAVDAYGRLKEAYVPVKDARAAIKKAPKTKTLSGADRQLEIVTIQDPRTGKTIEAVTASELQSWGLHAPAKPATDGRFDSAAAAAKRKVDEKQLAAENDTRAALLAAVRQAMHAMPRSAEDLHLVTWAVWDLVDYDNQCAIGKLWGYDDPDHLRAGMDDASPGDLTKLLLDCVLVRNIHVTSVYWLSDEPEVLKKAAALYGVQVPAPGAPTPSTAGARAKKAAAKTRSPAGAGADLASPAAAGDEGQDEGNEQMDDAGCAGGRTGAAEDA